MGTRPDGERDLSGPRLFLLSTAALFWELTMIRYVPGSIRVAGYFTNLVLLSTFLGLGTGTILGGRIKDPLRIFTPLVLLVSVCAIVFGLLDATNPAGQHIWKGGPTQAALGGETTFLSNIQSWFDGAPTMPSELLIPLLMVLLAGLFVPLGAAIGERFARMQPLRAYSWDIGGSLAGILLFTCLSALGSTPVIWFTLGFLLVGPMVLRRSWPARAVFLICAVLSIGASWILSSAYEWSPYQKISVSPVTPTALGGRGDEVVGWELKVNNDFHQMMLDLSDGMDPAGPLPPWRDVYDAPFPGSEPGDVLILGAGSGNDAMGALRSGATSVVAVDIDPVIVDLGIELHPERPYGDPRIEIVVDDARAYFKRTDRTFDTVVFGRLDSHTLLASMSSVRIDTFVYTLQSFFEVRRLVRPGGRIVMSFSRAQKWLAERIYHLLRLASGISPEIKHFRYTHCIIFTVHPPAEVPDKAAAVAEAEDMGLPTDDWPFFYLRERTIPGPYLFFIALTLVLGLVPMLLVRRGERSLNLQFLFLGAGFMLVETRSVTEMALLFGSTWAVNAITFGGILIMVFTANLVAMRWKTLRPEWLYPLVGLFILVHALVPNDALLAIPWWPRLAAAILLLFSPIFFAGMCFSASFRSVEKPHVSFGSNLLGAMIGGGLEYLSMVAGFAVLDGIAGILYALAFIAYMRSR